MLRFILLALLFIVIARIFWRFVDVVIAASRTPGEGGGSAPAVKLVRDPVCGTFVAPRAALSATANGTTHYFCSEECRAKFRHP
jgi:YHS domain-containing protein